MKSKPIAVLLTCTIDVKGIAYMERSDYDVRYKDYLMAFKKWLKQDSFSRLIFVENSNSDISEFKKLAENSNKKVEFISFNGQDFDRELGKGYGEQSAIAKVYELSKSINKVSGFLKVNGRYFLKNHVEIDRAARDGSDIVCDLSKMLSWADSRVFFASNEFYKQYLAKELVNINDSKGFFFEHALSKSALTGIVNDKKWALLPNVDLIGVSGTNNVTINASSLKGILKNKSFSLYYKVKSKIFNCHWR